MAPIATDTPMTVEDVQRQHPDWRGRPGTQRAARSVATDRQQYEALLRVHSDARQSRIKTEADSAQLEYSGPPAARIAAMRAIVQAREVEAAALEALAAHEPAVPEADVRAAVQADMHRTAIELAKLNVKLGAPAVDLVESLLVQAQSLNAACSVADGYFRPGDGGSPTGELVMGIRAYLPPDTKLYPPIDGEVIQMLGYWLRRARGEKFTA